MPEYSFELSTRTDYERIKPAELVVVEGIALYSDEVNELLDLSVYLDPDPDIRTIRRIKRDI